MQHNENDFGGTLVRDGAPPARFGPIEIAFIQRYTDVLERVAQEASTEALQDALASADDVGGLAGVLEHVAATLPPAQPDPLAGARMRAVRIRRELMDRAGGAFTTGQAAGLLGITPQAIHGRRERGNLLALRAPNGDYLYPRFQFSAQGVLPGLAEVLAAFQVDDPWTRLSVLLSPAGQLGGQTPVQALVKGAIREAIEAVAAYGEQVAG